MAENYIPISSWAEDDKPREKMLSKGVATLSTNELGSREKVGGAVLTCYLRE